LAIVVFGCLIVALLLVYLMLLVMLVTLYPDRGRVPLSLVWVMHPRRRSRGLAVLFVWVGICCAHVILFLLLGVAFKLVSGLSLQMDQPTLQVLTNLAVAVIVLFMATLSPAALLTFAPVGPTDGGDRRRDLPARAGVRLRVVGTWSGDDSRPARAGPLGGRHGGRRGGRLGGTGG